MATLHPNQLGMTHQTLDEDIRLFLHPTNVFIPSPAGIEPMRLKPFQDRAQRVLLVNRQHHQTQLATVNELNDSSLVVLTDLGAEIAVEQDDEIWVIFPVSSGQHYILKTKVAHVGTNHLTLRYLYPRKDVRWTFPVAAPVSCTLAPPVFVAALWYARVVREVLTLETGRIDQLTDSMDGGNSGGPSPLMQTLDDAPTVEGTLNNISLGGMALTLDARSNPEDYEQRLVRVRLELPDPRDAEQHLVMEPLGVIRKVATTDWHWRAHIEYLAPLPEDLNTTFQALALKDDSKATPGEGDLAVGHP